MFFPRGHFGKSVFPQDAYLYIRHLTFLNIPFIMRYKYVCNYTYIQAWKGTSNSPRYRTESSRQMRGARERTANTSRSRAPNEILYWFSVGCAGAQHPLSGWNKDAAVGIPSGKSGTAGSLFAEAGSVSCL